MDASDEQVCLGGGCFWCLEAVFRRVRGVSVVQSGYAGGLAPSPTYEDVCAGTTGHAEVVCLAFNPQVVSFESLLQIFFALHDPTTKDRQGADIGSQYRSIILYKTTNQKEVAEAMVKELNSSTFDGQIVTEIKPMTEFYPAESYHNNYYENNKNAGYCRIVIDPKIKKLLDSFPEML